MDGINRRGFLALSAVSTGALIAGSAHSAPFKTSLRKALIRGLPEAKAMEELRAAGFEGMECVQWAAKPQEAEAARKIADAAGIRVHSVLRGWCNVNSEDPAAVAADIESMKTALQTAQILGADAVLLVPCRVDGGPAPWDIQYTYDETTLHVSKVVAGDNSPHEAYIKAQNRATDTTRKAVGALIQEAENRGVVIALENVWNNLWSKPDFFADVVRSFKSPWVKAYLDLGNHVKYAPTPEWIRALGDQIAKCHVKDFKLKPNGQGGDFVDIRDGSNVWPDVRQALDAVGYNGWMTIEGSDGLSIDEQSQRLDMIIAGT